MVDDLDRHGTWRQQPLPHLQPLPGEVGSAGEALFARSNGNTPPAAAVAGGYMGSVGAMAEYGYGQVGPYREQAPSQAYGAHDHGRPTLPPMSFATGFDR